MSSLRSVMRASESETSLFFFRVSVLSDHFCPQEEEDIWGRTRKKKEKSAAHPSHSNMRGADVRTRASSSFQSTKG